MAEIIPIDPKWNHLTQEAVSEIELAYEMVSDASLDFRPTDRSTSGAVLGGIGGNQWKIGLAAIPTD